MRDLDRRMERRSVCQGTLSKQNPRLWIGNINERLRRSVLGYVPGIPKAEDLHVNLEPYGHNLFSKPGRHHGILYQTSFSASRKRTKRNIQV